MESCFDSCLWKSNNLKDNGKNQPSFQCQRTDTACDCAASDGRDGTLKCGGSTSQAQGDMQEKAHSGAKPPWLAATDDSTMQPSLVGLVSASNKCGKSHKLNPKQDGAAWAEKRNVQLEMEKRGEQAKYLRPQMAAKFW